MAELRLRRRSASARFWTERPSSGPIARFTQQYGDVFAYVNVLAVDRIVGLEEECSKNSLNDSRNSKLAVRTCGGFFDAGTKQRQLDELQKQIAEPNFWSDQDRSSKLLQQRARLEESSRSLDRQIIQRMEDVQALMELAREGEPVLDDFASQLKDTQHSSTASKRRSCCPAKTID